MELKAEDVQALMCADCGLSIILLKDYVTLRKKDHKRFWCPNGHRNYFAEQPKEEEKQEDTTKDKLLRLISLK